MPQANNSAPGPAPGGVRYDEPLCIEVAARSTGAHIHTAANLITSYRLSFSLLEELNADAQLPCDDYSRDFSLATSRFRLAGEELRRFLTQLRLEALPFTGTDS